jgi:hypothetical protein
MSTQRRKPQQAGNVNETQMEPTKLAHFQKNWTSLGAQIKAPAARTAIVKKPAGQNTTAR